MSYDDGLEQDKRLSAFTKKRELKGSSICITGYYAAEGPHIRKKKFAVSDMGIGKSVCTAGRDVKRAGAESEAASPHTPD